MAKISLRNYHEEIESLINRGRYDEAVAHCRQILEIYPKSVDTYRLLGKAFLEARRYTDAIDIFERVLSAVPDDFVSHLGLSIIREDEGNLDTAIWHMERAFEIQPYNSAIQEELRRLYERRDGSAPPRIRLSRPALARMYAKGNLYQQAIAETRSILNEDPQRFDLQILLGKLYLKTGKQVEAAEISSKVLNKLPYCLDANHVLVRILKESEHKQEYLLYRERLSSLNPYEHFATENLSTAELVSSDTVQLDKLDLSGDQVIPTEEKADWMATLGLTSSDFETQIDEELPDWLIAASAQIQTEESTEDTFGDQLFTADEDLFSESDADIDAIEWLGETEEDIEVSPDWITSEEDVASDELPDWMTASGWETAEETAQVADADLDTQTNVDAGFIESLDEDSEVDSLAQADIPDWLRELAPEDGETSVEAPLQDTETDMGEDEDLAALFAVTSEAVPEEEAIDLQMPADEIRVEDETDLDTEEEIIELEVPSAGYEVPSEVSEEEESLPDWLNEFVDSETGVGPESTDGPAPPQVDDLPAWLKDIEDEIVADEQPVAETPAPGDADLPEWLQEFDIEEEVVAAADTEVDVETESAPDWLSEITEEGAIEDTTAEFAVSAGESPDAELVKPTPDMDRTVEDVVEPAKPDFDEPPDFADADDALAWLAGLAASQETIESGDQFEAQVASVEEPEVQVEKAEETTEEPDTLGGMPESQGEIELESPPDFEDMDAAVAWLEGLAASQPLTPETSVKESPAMEVPEVMEQEIIEDESEEAEEEVQAASTEPEAETSEELSAPETPPQVDDHPRQAPIDINSASLVEIERLPGVGYRMAQAIVSHREEYGLFGSIDELANVPGVDPDDLFSLSEFLFVEIKDQAPKQPVAKADPGKLQSARQAVSSGDSPTALQHYMDLINGKTSLEEVIFDLNRMLQNRPDDFELWQLLGDAYMRNNQLIEAMQAYNKAEELLS